MSIKFEIKGMLAKLLATEDIIVEHKKVQTACFNVHTRVLTLPMWERASNSVYDLLVGHEVGHALFTPNEEWDKQFKIPMQFVNVCEDARIEKMMKRKYMGLAKTFFAGYKDLHDDDFFQIEDEDVSKFNLADRANLYFKIGSFLFLDFTSEEKEIINLIGSAETFADTLIAAEELYKYCKKEQNQVSSTHSSEIGDSKSPSPQTKEDYEDSEESEDNDSDSSQSDVDDKTGENNYETNNTSSPDEEPEVKTWNNFEDKIKNLVDLSSGENAYIQIPEVNLDSVIAKNEEVHNIINQFFDAQQKNYHKIDKDKTVFNNVDADFRTFKLSAQKEVNYLVKEFECRKAADAYSRASIARTGILDTSRLHSYKYNEDLFKKVSVIPDGKNHGLVFILDWSGSMSGLILDTCKQIFNLIWFCKKVSIPFEVYAFTNEWLRGDYDPVTFTYRTINRTPHYKVKDGIFVVDDSFSLMNILTSKVSGKELEKQLINIWRLAYAFQCPSKCLYTYPVRLSLSGTPLNESLICLHQILPKFQKENKLQKVQCIVLTDGEANTLSYHTQITRSWDGKSYMGCRSIKPDIDFLRDRKIGITYRFGHGYHKFTDVLLKNLKDKFPTVNFIGMRIISGREMVRFVNLYHHTSDKEYQVIFDDWKKVKSFTITSSGYDAYFGLSSCALSQEVEFEVKESATKSQIKSAFVKSLKTKKLNKKILNEFISLVV